MSGGIAQLVAVGAQDAHLVGSPEISFFRSTYKRHTNFSQTVERQVIQGNVSNGGMSTVRFERKGDLPAMCTSPQMTALPPRDTVLPIGAPRLPRLNSLWVVKSLMTKTPRTLLSLPQCSQPQTPPSRFLVTFSVAPLLPVSTHSASLSAKTSKLPSPSLPSSTTMWNFALLGAQRRPLTSGTCMPTTCTWIPKSVSSSPPTHKI